MQQNWTAQHKKQQGSCVQAGGTVAVYALLCWKKAGPGQAVDFGDLWNRPTTQQRKNKVILWGERDKTPQKVS